MYSRLDDRKTNYQIQSKGCYQGKGETGCASRSVTVSLSDFDHQKVESYSLSKDSGPPDPPSVTLPAAGNKKVIKWQNGQDRYDTSFRH